MRAIACLVLLCFVMTAFAENFLGLGTNNGSNCQYAAEVNCLGSKTLDDGTVLHKDDVKECFAPHVPCALLGFPPV